VEILGFYDPMTTPSTVRIDTPRAVKWLQNGAQPTDRVRILLRHAGVLKAHEEARLEAKRARKAAAEAAGGEATEAAGAVGTTGAE
jgi:ribosomal protein S16